MGRERSGGYADLERRGGGGTRACRGWSHVTCRCECVLWGGWEGRWGFGFVGLRGLGGGGALGEEGLLASVEVEAVAVVLVLAFAKPIDFNIKMINLYKNFALPL